MTTIDNENPTPEEETTPADSIAGSENTSPIAEQEETETSAGSPEENPEEETEETEDEYARSDIGRAVLNPTPSPKKGWFSTWGDFHWVVTLVLIVLTLMGFGIAHIQQSKGSQVPVNVYSKSGQCVTQHWHVPDRYNNLGGNYEAIVAAAKKDGAATLRSTAACQIHVVQP